jgi:hypothetical protein
LVSTSWEVTIFNFQMCLKVYRLIYLLLCIYQYFMVFHCLIQLYIVLFHCLNNNTLFHSIFLASVLKLKEQLFQKSLHHNKYQKSEVPA